MLVQIQLLRMEEKFLKIKKLLRMENKMLEILEIIENGKKC